MQKSASKGHRARHLLEKACRGIAGAPAAAASRLAAVTRREPPARKRKETGRLVMSQPHSGMPGFTVPSPALTGEPIRR